MKPFHSHLIFLFAFCAFLISQGCCNRRKSESDSTNKVCLEDSTPNKGCIQTYRFPYVTLPSMITDPKQRNRYLGLHFWDSMSFADTVYFTSKNVMMNAFAEYFHILSSLSDEDVYQCIDRMVEKADTTSFALAYVRKMMEEALYNPNSAIRNDLYYSFFLKSYLQSDNRNRDAEPRDKSQLEIVSMNQVGMTANDFDYITPEGKITSLKQLQASYLVLFFYNPGCHGCKEVTDELKGSDVLNEKIRQSVLKVLALYPDNNEKDWRATFSELPDTWLKGFDKNQKIEDVPLYDLKAIPTIYLLDKWKKVILKDTNVRSLELFLNQL